MDITINNIIRYLFFLFFACIFFSCEKTDDFKDELDGIPQISYGTRYKYKASYMVDDTLTITGILYPEKGLKIMVGEVDAPIVKKQVVDFYGAVGGRDILDQVSVIITEEMGTGKDRPVSVILGSNKVEGSPIAIYALSGEGSFTQALTITNYTTATIGRQNTYLHCINGKGDVYYLGFSDKNLWHIKKDGMKEVLLTESELKNGESWNFNTISPFLAGGVNPQGTKAWVSIQTQNDGYRFVEINLQTKAITTLNTSTDIAVPYQGSIGEVNTVINGIYPDSKGNVYVKIGTTSTGANDNTQVFALFNSANGRLTYIYKTNKAQAADLPGASLDLGYYPSVLASRIYPEENALYVMHEYTFSYNGFVYQTKGITLYNLQTKQKLYTMRTNGGDEYTGTFSGTPQYMLNDVFGLLPMAGQRIVGLYGLELNADKLPQWLVFSFGEERTYRYAKDKVVLGSYYFGPNKNTTRIDEMLNYDEEGHLYSTANGRGLLIKTAIQ